MFKDSNSHINESDEGQVVAFFECTKCGEVLPLNKKSTASNGKARHCKPCDGQMRNARRRKNGEQEKNQKRMQQRTATAQGWCQSKFHAMRDRVINVGMDTEDVKCENCGVHGDETRIVGHHDDYSRPEAIRLLCDACHNQWHERFGKRKRREGRLAHLRAPTPGGDKCKLTPEQVQENIEALMSAKRMRIAEFILRANSLYPKCSTFAKAINVKTRQISKMVLDPKTVKNYPEIKKIVQEYACWCLKHH
jgi:hypothetical protein